MRALRTGLVVLGALLALVAVAAVILVRNFDPNAYKDDLTAYVQERTGRTLTIDDDIGLTLFPWFAIETGGMTLSNDPRFGDSSLVTVEKLSGRVRVWPLLRRRVEIGRVILDGVNLTLGTDADGRGNWQDLVESSPVSGDGSEPADTQPPTVAALAVEGVELRNTRIEWRDFATGETRYVIRDCNLETGRIDGDAPVDFDLAFSFVDIATGITTAIEMNAVARRSPEPGLSDIETRVTVQSADGSDRATGTVRAGRVAFSADRAVSATAVSAELRWLEPLNGRVPIDFEIEAAAIDLDADRTALDVRNLVTRSGAVTAEGDLHAGGLDESPAVDATLSMRGDSLRSLFDVLAIDWPDALAGDDGGAFAASARLALVSDPLSLRLDDVGISALGLGAIGSASIVDDRLVASIDVPTFAPGDTLLAWIEPALPAGVNLRGIDSASLAGTLTHALGSDRLALDDVAVALDAARIRGNLALSGLDEPDRIGGKIEVTGLDDALVDALFSAWLPADLREAPIGTFRLDTSFDHRFAEHRTEFDSLALAAYGLSARGRLAIADRDGGLIVEGRADVDEFSPRDLLARFELPVPESRDPTTLRKARLSADFRTTGASGEFRDIAMTLDDSSITGSFGVDDFANPSYRFDLQADRIDVDRYLPPKAEDVAADGSAAAPRTVGDIELATEPLTATRVSGTASVGDLGIAGLSLQQVSTGLVVGDGRGRLDPVTAELYGGQFAGRLSVDAAGDVKRTELAGTVDDVQIAPLLAALLGDSHIGGRGSIDLDLTGTGGTVDEVLASANGFMNVSLVGGWVQGFNLERTLCVAFNAIDRSPSPPAAPDVTSYTEIRTDATVANGLASTSNLLASTGSVAVTGAGSMRLSDRYLDFDLRARLDDRIAIDRCDRINTQVGNSFPFTLKGTLPNVIPVPDLAQYLQDRAREGIRDTLEDRIRESILDRLR